jgi:hypothetical protein
MRVCLRGCKLRGEVATTVTNPRTLIDDVNKRYRHTERERLDQRRLRIDNDGAVTHTHTLAHKTVAFLAVGSYVRLSERPRIRRVRCLDRNDLPLGISQLAHISRHHAKRDSSGLQYNETQQGRHHTATVRFRLHIHSPAPRKWKSSHTTSPTGPWKRPMSTQATASRDTFTSWVYDTESLGKQQRTSQMASGSAFPNTPTCVTLLSLIYGGTCIMPSSALQSQSCTRCTTMRRWHTVHVHASDSSWERLR